MVWRFSRSRRTMELHSQQNGTAIQRSWPSCLQSTIHFNGDSTDAGLLFQKVHSVNLLSVYGTVANWCHQFALTEEAKGRVGIIVGNKILTVVEPEEVELSVSLPTQSGTEKKFWASKLWKRRHSLHNYVKKLSSNILWLPRIRTKFDQMQMTDGDKLPVCAELFRVLDLIRKPVLWQLFPKAQSLDQFWKFILWKFVTDMEQKLRFHQSQTQRTHLALYYPTYCSKTFKDQEEVNSMKKKEEPRASRKLVLTLSAFRLQEHPWTHREPFLRMRGNGRSFMRIHQMKNTWQLQYPRWLQPCCVIMTKMEDKLMVQDIGIQSGEYCWKRLHKEHEIRWRILVSPDSWRQQQEKTRILQG